MTSAYPDDRETGDVRAARGYLETAASLARKVATGGPFVGPHVDTPLLALVDAYIAARDAEALLARCSSPAAVAAAKDMAAAGGPCRC
jgi:hypothetical protein